MDQYIKDVIDSRKMLIVEKAVDEYIQAQNEIIVESTTVADNFCDADISDEELGEIIDDLAGDLEDIPFDDEYYEEDLEVGDSVQLSPEVEELD